MSIFGNKLKISLFGSSHEASIGLTIHNYPSGVTLNITKIKEKLKLRNGLNYLTSKRFEEENFQFLSGLFNGITTGAPLTFIVENKDIKSDAYIKSYGLARPSHADYTYFKKYQGFNDFRGGGSSSGRLTVVLIILGAICEQILEEKDIIIASRMKSIYNIEDSDILINDDLLKFFQSEVFPVYSEKTKEQMLIKINEIKEEEDSLGGVVQTFIKNLPFGLGNPFFDSFESIISHLIFSIPGVKGIEFGAGFNITKMLGSTANDQIAYVDEKIVYKTNNSGGINGGITNSDVVIFQTAFKPTPSISKPQATINFINKTNQVIEIKGRHDVIIAIKGLHVVNALSNYAVLDMLLGENNGFK